MSTALLFNIYRTLVTSEEAAEHWAIQAPKGDVGTERKRELDQELAATY